MTKATTRQEALTKGLKLYMPSSPCKNGHMSERHVTTGCVACRQSWAAKNAERLRSYKASWNKARYDSQRGVRGVFHGLKNQAAIDGQPFDLNAIDVIRLINSVSECPVTQLPIAASNRSKPAFVLRDPSKGWRPGNVVVVSHEAKTFLGRLPDKGQKLLSKISLG